MENSDNNLTVERKGNHYTIADGVTGQKLVFVNVYFVKGSEGPGGSWALIDTGFKGSAKQIIKLAEEKFGPDAKPSAILLTHGHFDHAGSVKELAHHWNVPVYAHHLEIPYLTGLSAYPPPDPGVGGGGMAFLSFLYPNKAINLGGLIQPLPQDGSVPGLPEWRWHHTPGHTAGHVSFFRERDHTLLAGDALSTRNPDSMLSAITDEPEVCGPPSYFTSDWVAARKSVEALADLKPAVMAAGHGIPMRGERMQDELSELVKLFGQLAVPAQGRYVNEPAITNEQGVVSLPEAVSTPATKAMIAAGVATAAGVAAFVVARQMKKKKAEVESPLENHPYEGQEMNLSAYGEIPSMNGKHTYRREKMPTNDYP